MVEHALRAVRDCTVIDNNQQNREGNDKRERILVSEVHNSTNVEAETGFHGAPTGHEVDGSKYQIGNINCLFVDSAFLQMKEGTSVTLYPFFFHSPSILSKSFTVSEMVRKKEVTPMHY